MAERSEASSGKATRASRAARRRGHKAGVSGATPSVVQGRKDPTVDKIGLIPPFRPGDRPA